MQLNNWMTTDCQHCALFKREQERGIVLVNTVWPQKPSFVIESFCNGQDAHSHIRSFSCIQFYMRLWGCTSKPHLPYMGVSYTYSIWGWDIDTLYMGIKLSAKNRNGCNHYRTKRLGGGWPCKCSALPVWIMNLMMRGRFSPHQDPTLKRAWEAV